MQDRNLPYSSMTAQPNSKGTNVYRHNTSVNGKDEGKQHQRGKLLLLCQDWEDKRPEKSAGQDKFTFTSDLQDDMGKTYFIKLSFV